MVTRGFVLGFVVAALCALSVAAQAEDGSQSTSTLNDDDDEGSGGESDYLMLVRKGLREFEMGNWSEAKSFFARAHELHPSARTFRGLGMASYELRHYVASIAYLTRALAETRRPLTDGMREHVRELLGQARTFIAYFELAITPEDAVLRIDGGPPSLEEEGLLMLDPGAHEVVVRAEGFETATRRVVAQGGVREVLRVELQAPGTPLQVAVQPVEAGDVGFFATRTGQQWWGFGLGTAGLVGLGVGGAFGILAIARHGDSEDNCDNNVCNDEGLAVRNDARQAGDVATVALIAGGTLLAAGVVVYLTGSDSDEPGSTGVAITPLVVRDGAGLRLWGHL